MNSADSLFKSLMLLGGMTIPEVSRLVQERGSRFKGLFSSWTMADEMQLTSRIEHIDFRCCESIQRSRRWIPPGYLAEPLLVS